jgi:hypothetical protein
MVKLYCYKAIVLRNAPALILAGQAYAKPSPAPAKFLRHLHLLLHRFHARDRVNGCVWPMDEAGISWLTVAEEAIVAAFRRRICAPAVNVAMFRVPLRRLQLLQRPREVVPRRHLVGMVLVIPPRQLPPEHRPHPIPVRDRADIAGALCHTAGN